MRKHPEAHSRVRRISHTAVITHPPSFHHLPSLAVIKGDSNVKSDQVTGGHLTSLISIFNFVEFSLKSFMSLT